MMECPFINREVAPGPSFYEPVDHPLDDGSSYRFYWHDDGREDSAPKGCQFCRFVGRTYDYWACLNEWQWQKCPTLHANVEQLDAETRESLPFLIYPIH